MTDLDSLLEAIVEEHARANPHLPGADLLRGVHNAVQPHRVALLELDEERLDATLRKVVREATLLLNKERLEAEAQYSYTAGEVKHLLSSSVFVDAPDVKDQDGRADVLRGLDLLHPDTAHLLRGVYQYRDVRPTDPGVAAAVAELTLAMNGG